MFMLHLLRTDKLKAFYHCTRICIRAILNPPQFAPVQYVFLFLVRPTKHNRAHSVAYKRFT